MVGLAVMLDELGSFNKRALSAYIKVLIPGAEVTMEDCPIDGDYMTKLTVIYAASEKENSN